MSKLVTFYVESGFVADTDKRTLRSHPSLILS